MRDLFFCCGGNKGVTDLQRCRPNPFFFRILHQSRITSRLADGVSRRPVPSFSGGHTCDKAQRTSLGATLRLYSATLHKRLAVHSGGVDKTLDPFVNHVYKGRMKRTTTQAARSILEGLRRFKAKADQLESQTYTHADGTVLYPAELDVIDAVGHHPGLNVSRLAAMNGVSRAAVSRMTTGLVRKGMLEKERPAGRREVSLRLTAKGEAVHHETEAHYDDLYAALEAHLGAGDPGAQAAEFCALLALVEEHLEQAHGVAGSS